MVFPSVNGELSVDEEVLKNSLSVTELKVVEAVKPVLVAIENSYSISEVPSGSVAEKSKCGVDEAKRMLSNGVVETGASGRRSRVVFFHIIIIASVESFTVPAVASWAVVTVTTSPAVKP